MIKIFLSLITGVFSFLREFLLKFFLIIGALVIIFGLVLPRVSADYTQIRDTFINNLGIRLGFINQEIPISGTGSMYPTFAKGQGKTLEEQSSEIVATPGMRLFPTGFNLLGRDFFGYQIQRQDIVSFSNSKVSEITEKLHGKEAGFVKRVIGIPGDEIELREGLVYLNGEALDEPYIAKARSTFGSKEFPECKVFKVPLGKLFVMGDNRKESLDSRFELGVIGYSDIDHVIPTEAQKGILDKSFRDTGDDLEESAKIRIDKNQFLSLLNKKRKEVGKSPLKYQSKLEISAKNRGEKILEFNDFSFEAKKSGYDLKRAVKEANYTNILYGEIPIQGYYDAEELIGSFFEFPESQEFFSKGEYQDIGIAEVEGQIDNCPTQVIVLHLGGYIPPNYSKELVDSYKSALEKLNEVLPSWEGISGDSRYDQNQVKELIDTMYSLRGIYERVYKKMSGNEYLSSEEEAQIKEVDLLQKKIVELQKKINER